MTGKLNCSAYKCRNLPAGTISRFGEAPYCYVHLQALAASNAKRRPKPVVTYYPDFDIKSVEKDSIRANPIVKANLSSKKIIKPNKTEVEYSLNTGERQVVVQDKVVKKHRTLKLVAGLLIFFALGGILRWNENNQNHIAAVEALQERNNFAQNCFLIKGEDEAAKAGPVGSRARQDAVLAYFNKVVESTCVEWGDGSIFSNPFYKSSENSQNWQDLKNAFIYSLQRWNGVEPFSLRCADGWNSPSIGKSGACSHHGGVVSGFNEFNDWDLSNHIEPSKRIYPSLEEMKLAANS